MKGVIIGYDAVDGTITIKLSTMKDDDCIPLGKEVEIKIVE